MPTSTDTDQKLRLTRRGLSLHGTEEPLFVASVHYWRHERSHWKAVLSAVSELGFRGIDTYVPWSVHEFEPGGFDFGARDPRLDVGAFLREAAALGLYAVVRPGPHINSELTCFGIPKRIIWRRACQARSPNDRPVILPVPPLAFPVPSYASEAFLGEAGDWLRSVAEQLAPLQQPDGPIALVQLDNEAALYFRDGVFDQDYHPDALAAFRSHLKQRYERLELLRKAYANPALSFSSVDPPRQLRWEPPSEIRRSMDWAEFQEELVTSALGRFRQALVDGGLDRVPFTHNLPPGAGATPLDADQLGNVVDLVGMDIYQGANEVARRTLAESVSELRVQSDARNVPTFATELGVGFPPYFPPLGQQDSEFCALTAIAYGANGFNLYMAVERDRWIGAPIDETGVPRPNAEFYRKLMAALEAVRFDTLQRRVAVGLLVPNSERRFARVLHAFGPLSAAFFHVAGAGPALSALEPVGLGEAGSREPASTSGPSQTQSRSAQGPSTQRRSTQRRSSELPQCARADAFFAALRRALDARHVPWTTLTEAHLTRAAPTLAQTVLLTGGHLEQTLADEIRVLWQQGVSLSLGPIWPTRTPAFGPLELERSGAHSLLEPHLDDARLESELDGVLAGGGLRPLPVSGKIHATLYDDSAGKPRLLFLINAGPEPEHADVKLGSGQLLDRLSGEVMPKAGRIAVPARTTRMLEIVQGS